MTDEAKTISFKIPVTLDVDEIDDVMADFLQLNGAWLKTNGIDPEKFANISVTGKKFRKYFREECISFMEKEGYYLLSDAIENMAEDAIVSRYNKQEEGSYEHDPGDRAGIYANYNVPYRYGSVI